MAREVLRHGVLNLRWILRTWTFYLREHICECYSGELSDALECQRWDLGCGYHA